ncbi:hypothetical protein AAFF_G00084060 [Aldrovandia affinis]|uniref:Uncharacterized protein n=1 Tax=Aldrovandia affinis TaxID=143900 RepID=A0AAD7WCW5_9TELE|nr:hypothetical protein AAFF_G00084060 [Aldrovandia affinis]
MTETNNKRLDELVKEISGLRESLHYTQKDVEELIAKDKRSSSKLSEIDSEVSIVAANIRSFLPKLDYLEGQSRRNNIVIDGIQESGNESWAESEEKVRNSFLTSSNSRGLNLKECIEPDDQLEREPG